MRGVALAVGAVSLLAGRRAQGCPGTPECSGHGTCLTETKVCMCEPGFGGNDCGGEVPLYLDLTNIAPPELKDAQGIYKLDAMYLYVHDAAPADDETLEKETKWISYDYAAKGWSIGKWTSGCPDDVCFFAYSDAARPPTFGYTYGAQDLHVHHAQMLFDQAQNKLGTRQGYDFRVAFQDDPTVSVPGLAMFNGRYIVQPRYVHNTNHKYEMFPLTFDAPAKKWVLSGMHQGQRKIIARATDPSENRYIPPPSPWAPAEYNLQFKTTCANHISDMACQHVESMCALDTGDGDWVRKCCRRSCTSCQEARSGCSLPFSEHNIGR